MCVCGGGQLFFEADDFCRSVCVCVCGGGGQLFFEADDFCRSVCVWGGQLFFEADDFCRSFVDLYVCGGAVIL